MKSGIIVYREELQNLKSTYTSREKSNFLNDNLNSFIDKMKRDEINIKDYIEDDIIDVTKLSKAVFPTFDEIDFFISYSTKDAEIVAKLVDFLTDLGFKVFVDNQNWANAYSLLKKFDDEICLNRGTGYYRYSQRNSTTANIYSMLSIALTKVISKSKYFILVESENSIIEDKNKFYTNSPWLELEIEIFNLIAQYTNIYKEKRLLAEQYADESAKYISFKWIREYNLREEYFSFLKNEDLDLIKKAKESENKFEKIDKCLLQNYEKISLKKNKSSFFLDNYIISMIKY